MSLDTIYIYLSYYAALYSHVAYFINVALIFLTDCDITDSWIIVQKVQFVLYFRMPKEAIILQSCNV